MTLERIRDWQRAFKGAPSRRVPFGAHAVKYLLHLLEQQAEANQRGPEHVITSGVEGIERVHGNQDPDDAPWITRPRTGQEWRHRFDPKPPVIGQNANPIPPDADPPDQGTDDYPEWEQYQERRHEDAMALTAQERADEHQLREKYAPLNEDELMDLSHLDTPADAAAKAIEDEVQQQQGDDFDDESMSRFF
ncbi:hypothetical protein R0K19_20815 [Bacillus sp. SIMBA_161]